VLHVIYRVWISVGGIRCLDADGRAPIAIFRVARLGSFRSHGRLPKMPSYIPDAGGNAWRRRLLHNGASVGPETVIKNAAGKTHEQRSPSNKYERFCLHA